MSREDFSEIGHTGGKVTFTIECDKEGHISYQVGYSISSSHPASMAGIYAHPDGFACGNIVMGGIGSPFNTPPLPNCIPVIMASDSQGMFGHECPDCKKHFRTENIPATFPLNCPYCGLRTDSFHFLTPPQKSYVTHYVASLRDAAYSAHPDSITEVIIDMNKIADSIETKPRPDFYYTSITQQTEFRCSKCNCYNDIRGRYGYCASCGWRNTAESQKESMEIMRESMVNGDTSPSDALKQSVSEFDSAARDYVNQLTSLVPMKTSRRNELNDLLFHNIDKLDKTLLPYFGINLLRGKSVDKKFVQMMFSRRHVYEHDGGVATKRYVEKSGDSKTEEGDLIRETIQNTNRIISCLNSMITTFENEFHDIFPPEPFCIEIENNRKKRISNRKSPSL